MSRSYDSTLNYEQNFKTTIPLVNTDSELFPNSNLAGCQAILTLDMLGFSYCHIKCQDLIQIQLKIQTKL